MAVMSSLRSLQRARLCVGLIVEAMWRLANVWVAEAKRFLPDSVASRIFDAGQVSLVVSAAKSGIAVEVRKGHVSKAASEDVASPVETKEVITKILREMNHDRRSVKAGIRLPRKYFLTRHLCLPSEARASIDRLLREAIKRQTPFSLDDIVFGYAVSQPFNGKITVTQWIVKRAYLRENAESLGVDSDELSFICGDVDQHTGMAPMIDLRPPRASLSLFGVIAASLCSFAVLLILTSGCVSYWRQQQAIDTLESMLVSATAKAKLVRVLDAGIREKQGLVAEVMNERYGSAHFLEILDGLTGILPAGTWITELRFAGRSNHEDAQVLITGYSSSAPDLIGKIEGSSYFRDAVFAAPVTVDPLEKRDRFVIQAKLSRP